MQYKKYFRDGRLISCSHGSNCYSVNGKVAVVRNIVEFLGGEIYAVCQFFEKQGSFGQYPADSTFVGIKRVTNLSEELCSVALIELTEKLILLPLPDGGSVAFIQLHDQ